MSGILDGWKTPRNTVLPVLLDRSIDHRLAAELRRIPGCYAKSLAEMYGDQRAQQMEDVEFIEDAGKYGWVVWTQNPKMWLVPSERGQIIASKTHVFTMGSATMTLSGKGFVLGRHFLSIKRRHRNQSHCFWRLYVDRAPIKDAL